MFYCLARQLLFSLDPETAHDLTIHGLSGAARTGLLGLALPTLPACSPRTVMGISFPNPLGLAAGLDKNGECIDGLLSTDTLPLFSCARQSRCSEIVSKLSASRRPESRLVNNPVAFAPLRSQFEIEPGK